MSVSAGKVVDHGLWGAVDPAEMCPASDRDGAFSFEDFSQRFSEKVLAARRCSSLASATASLPAASDIYNITGHLWHLCHE